ncbi:MAG: outer membrane beta-barrel protein [Bacteroidia bacterium]
MKKSVFVFSLFTSLLISSQLMAQAFDDGKNLISLGFGTPPTSRITESLSMYQNDLNYNYKNYGTVVLKYEHGFSKYFGVGLNLEYSGANATYQYNNIYNQGPYTETDNNSVMGAYLRLNGHYPIGESFDIFCGIGLGFLYTVNDKSNNDPNPTPSDPNASKTTSLVFDSPQFTFGARYMVKEHFGLFAEVGWASTTFQVGITVGL